MIKIENYENTILALVNKEPAKAIKIIDDEIAVAKKRGYHKNVARLKHLQRSIPNAATMTSSSFAAPAIAKTVNITPRNDSLYLRIEPEYSLSEVALDANAKDIVKNLINEWRHRDELLSHSFAPTNKLLLYGPPGTGKTKLAHAIAYELDFPLVLVRLDELISSYLGKTGKNIREVFDMARNENVVLLLDEIDTIAKNRTDNQDLGELKRVVTVFLQNIDLLSENSVVIGATNHEEILDKAIWRRFPQKIQFNLPDTSQRKRMLNIFLQDRAKTLPIDDIAEVSEGLSGSSIKDFSDAISKVSIIKGEQLSKIDALSVMLAMLGKEGSNNKDRRKNIYRVAKILYKNGYTLKEIEAISNTPYTTLREHLI